MDEPHESASPHFQELCVAVEAWLTTLMDYISQLCLCFFSSSFVDYI